jgi:hypothetical protein
MNFKPACLKSFRGGLALQISDIDIQGGAARQLWGGRAVADVR